MAIRVVVSFVAALALLGSSEARASDAFWHGGDVRDALSHHPEDPAAAQAAADAVQTELISLSAKLDRALRNPGNNPEQIYGVTVSDESKAWRGLTLLTSLNGKLCEKDRTKTCYAILVDMDGTIVNEWQLSAGPFKMFPGGRIMGGPTGRSVNGDSLVELDWCGRFVRTWFDQPWHHDYQREGSAVGYYEESLSASKLRGKRLLFISRDFPSFETDEYTRAVSSEHPLQDERIRIVDSSSGTVLFDWKAREHIEEFGFTPVARQAISRTRNGSRAGHDWAHANNVDWVGPNKHYNKGDLRFNPEYIVFDFRHANLGGIIATSDHPDGRTWRRGDIVWKIGPHYGAGHPEQKLGTIIGPHALHVIPWGLPGAGNMLVFDNGGAAGYGELVTGLGMGVYPNLFRDYSRVIEFDPVTLEIVWKYEHTVDDRSIGGHRKFYSRLISNAQRLPNGNTLITEGNPGRSFEVTRSGALVWEYIFDGGVSAPTIPVVGNSVYRSYRIPYEWVEGLSCP